MCDFFDFFKRTDYTEGCHRLNYSFQPIRQFVFGKWKMPFNDLVIQTNQVRLESGSQRLLLFLQEMVDSLPPGSSPPPCSIFWNYTAWLTCSLELLISDKSGFLKHKCRNGWRNLGFCLCALTPPPRGSRLSAAVWQEPYFRVISDSKKIQGYYVPFALSNCSCACSLSVEQMRLSWPALVSPDSYIVNQSSFSSINDKDLHNYKNLRNLWVCATRSDCLHTRICWNSMWFDGHRINNASHLMNSPCDCERSIFDAAHMAHFIQSLGWDQLSYDNVARKLPIFCLVWSEKKICSG